jgi:hypothetical protein
MGQTRGEITQNLAERLCWQVARRGPTVRHGQGKTAWTARQEPEGAGVTALTTDDQQGTPDHARQADRRDCHANPIQAAVVRTWHGQGDGPGGNTVFLTNASVQNPLQVFGDDDARRLMEHGCLEATKPPWGWGPPPQNTPRAVRVHVMLTLLLCALATAYRRPCEHEDTGGEPVGWQRWRRQLLERTRDHVIIFAQGCYGIFHMPSTRCCWESNWRMCLPASAHSGKFSPNMGSQRRADLISELQVLSLLD